MKRASFIRFISMLVVCFGITTCIQAQNDSARHKQIVGNDQDSHGCKPSAGYTWSKVLNNCVRVWEAGKRLNPVDTAKQTMIISGFVIFSADQKTAEVFLPGQMESVLLEGKINPENIMVWETGEWLLKDPADCKLFKNGKLYLKAN